VTLVKAEVITAHVRLRGGGAARSLRLERPLPIAQIRKFKPELIAEVDRSSTGTAIARSPTSSTSAAAGLGKRSPST